MIFIYLCILKDDLYRSMHTYSIFLHRLFSPYILISLYIYTYSIYLSIGLFYLSRETIFVYVFIFQWIFIYSFNLSIETISLHTYSAYCIWSVISSIPNLNRWSSSLGLFSHVPDKRPIRLRLEIEITWHPKCNRLYYYSINLYILIQPLHRYDFLLYKY